MCTKIFVSVRQDTDHTEIGLNTEPAAEAVEGPRHERQV
jgi:hypothetical protein